MTARLCQCAETSVLRALNRPIPRAHSCVYVARRNVIVSEAWAEAREIRPAPGESAGAYDRRIQAFVNGQIEAKLRAARLARRL